MARSRGNSETPLFKVGQERTCSTSEQSIDPLSFGDSRTCLSSDTKLNIEKSQKKFAHNLLINLLQFLKFYEEVANSELQTFFPLKNVFQGRN